MDNKVMQGLLNTWDKGRTTPLVMDGIIGPLSREKIRRFQKEHGLVVDGIAGPITKYELMFYKYKDFEKSEFKCKCGGRFCNGYPAKVEESLLKQLQQIRNYFGKPVIITSGIRCRTHNHNVAGADTSQHVHGKAADIKVQGVSPDLVYSYANQINRDGCVIRYKTFNHIDRRGYRLRLDYRNR
ncbi:peptidoglycan-binding protein [Alkalibacter rhizosphaerae]|uniref:Peptidoglycan-binding protein n=1 Tax=Alkalibacter rhizosphaerae TaxID=2815577 RepID=A0A974XKJ0_9FIRM|nr:D-Ala-D-Ala carboxypeptidase family metallohydrolase [Alkalibacter rhizosphaerae]QSX07651.1 peptidoglycan-binding protein [Alkalibacter rhizosphaerae]